MSQAVRQAVARGDYDVDPEAVASAMIARALALRAARGHASCSEVLIAADRIEIRRTGAEEMNSCPLEGAA
jgi:hypothetical protein